MQPSQASLETGHGGSKGMCLVLETKRLISIAIIIVMSAGPELMAEAGPPPSDVGKMLVLTKEKCPRMWTGPLTWLQRLAMVSASMLSRESSSTAPFCCSSLTLE